MGITAKAARKLKSVYIDEQVIIYLRDMTIATVDENNQEVKLTAMIEGYVVDIDQDFLYLGLPDGTITKTVAHELAQLVELHAMGSDQFDLETNFDGDTH